MQTEVELLSWVAVVAFYVARDLAHAVFDVDAEFSEACRHPLSHTNQDLAAPGTNTVIKRHYRSVSSAYLDLYSMSRGVRYEGQTVSDVQLTELLGELGEVGRWAQAQVVKQGRTVPDWVQQLASTPSPEPEGAQSSP